MKTESKTLREFSLKLNSKRGDSFDIRYGYDASAKHSGVYIKASINGSDYLSNKQTLKRIRSLKIDPLNNLIDALGTDVTGAPYNYEDTSKELIEDIGISGDWDAVIKHYRITTDEEEEELDAFYAKYEEASDRSAKTILKRYNNSRRIEFLEKSKELVKSLRELYWEGVEVGDNTYIPTTEGILKKNHIPFYYKRDVDYVRKARYKVFTKILNRKYVPFK